MLLTLLVLEIQAEESSLPTIFYESKILFPFNPTYLLILPVNHLSHFYYYGKSYPHLQVCLNSHTSPFFYSYTLDYDNIIIGFIYFDNKHKLQLK